jgi:DnaJ-class molecular chaperone
MARTFSSTGFYDLFGLDRNFQREDLDRTFRKLAKRYHPDGVEDPAQKEVYLRKLQQITEAYNVLKDDNLRRYYNDWCQKRDNEEELERKRQKERIFNLDSYISKENEAEHLMRGLTFLDEGKASEAMTQFKMALHVAPRFNAARFFLGRSQLRLGGSLAAEGRRNMNEAIQRDPNLAVFMHEAQAGMRDFSTIDRNSLEFEDVPEPEPDSDKKKPWWRFGH